MSDLNPKSTQITLNGKQYGLRFTLNAIDDIQDKFDIPISELNKILKNDKSIFKNMRYILTVLINEDISVQNDNGANIALLDEKQVGRYITAGNLTDVMSAVLTAFSAGTPKASEDDENFQKNV